MSPMTGPLEMDDDDPEHLEKKILSRVCLRSLHSGKCGWFLGIRL